MDKQSRVAVFLFFHRADKCNERNWSLERTDCPAGMTASSVGARGRRGFVNIARNGRRVRQRAQFLFCSNLKLRSSIILGACFSPLFWVERREERCTGGGFQDLRGVLAQGEIIARFLNMVRL